MTPKAALALAIALVIAPHLALAFEPDLPSAARPLADQLQAGRAFDLPVGATLDGTTPSERVHGAIRVRSWRLEGGQLMLRELEETLAAQLVSEGYEIALHCQTEDCGGFDFRFDALVLPPPDMFVDLSNYRFLSAKRGGTKGTEAVTVMLSHTARAATIQTVEVSPAAARAATGPDRVRPAATTPPAPQAPAGTLDALTRELTEFGHVVLGDLTFETGSSTLAERDYESLIRLSQWLRAKDGRRIALVGHTDSEGALEPNVQLSMARAAAVEVYLTERLGVAPGQIEAHGIGYLAPLASNASAAGRDRNRRVEAVLVSAP
ncbi:OmpA family protein [Shimia sp.]|uniref:OmpA family protein n=1 Tax=Shimia sp. TaxID=1954381 RepID=UPI003565B8D8